MKMYMQYVYILFLIIQNEYFKIPRKNVHLKKKDSLKFNSGAGPWKENLLCSAQNSAGSKARVEISLN